MRQDQVSRYRTLRELYVNGTPHSRGSSFWRQWLCISLSSGLLSCVIRWKFTDVSKESAMSFFKKVSETVISVLIVVRLVKEVKGTLSGS